MIFLAIFFVFFTSISYRKFLQFFKSWIRIRIKKPLDPDSQKMNAYPQPCQIFEIYRVYSKTKRHCYDSFDFYGFLVNLALEPRSIRDFVKVTLCCTTVSFHHGLKFFLKNCRCIFSTCSV